MNGRSQRYIARPRQSLNCGSCRRRKVRCSREQPVCASCARFGDECQYESTTPGDSSSAKRKAASSLAREHQESLSGVLFIHQNQDGSNPSPGSIDGNTSTSPSQRTPPPSQDEPDHHAQTRPPSAQELSRQQVWAQDAVRSNAAARGNFQQSQQQPAQISKSSQHPTAFLFDTSGLPPSTQGDRNPFSQISGGFQDERWETPYIEQRAGMDLTVPQQRTAGPAPETSRERDGSNRSGPFSTSLCPPNPSHGSDRVGSRGQSSQHDGYLAMHNKSRPRYIESNFWAYLDGQV